MKSGVSPQIISLPSGGGAQSGMGEKFSPDLFTGTGNFTIPIALPSGRNGFQPDINLVYSTGNGNGPYGLGWDLSIPGVSRKTSKGVPIYDENKDVFILSGAEDLVPVNVNGNRTQYRPRTEGLYAIIERVMNANNDYWEVKSKDGLISIYGTPNAKGADPAVIYDPEAPDNISSWKLTETRDPFGNCIIYTYERDLQQTENRHWNQIYLLNIRYVDYQDAGGNERFLIKAGFEYEERPDPFSTFRNGFEVRTTRRCVRIIVETVTETDVLKSKAFELQYTESPLNRASLLSEIQTTGYDGAETQPLPPVSFKYTEFDIEKRDFFPLQGSELPLNSLASSDTELVDLFGNGLPDIIQMNGTIRYWRNLGQGRFEIPRLMKNSPGGLTLEDPDVQMLDANGEGKADLMVNQVGLSGYYPLKFTGEWDRRSFQKYDVSPSFSLQDPEVRLFDLDGDGVTDALRTSARFECFFQDADEGWNRTLRVERKQIETFPDVSFSDPRVKLADLTGDGLQDIVLVHDGNIEYWPYMGHGKWGKRIHMANSLRLPHGYDPKRILIGDVDGDGLADIVYVDHRKVLLWINQGGNSWSDPIEIDGTPPFSDADAVRLIDLLGSGVKGVLWSADATNLSRNHMYFLDFTGGAKPYLLHEMDNNIGAITRVGYKPSTDYYLADQQNRNTQWKTNLPFPSQVVSKVEIIDVFSEGKLTTEYHYHHGYWDGAEREFRGFGRVDQYDTESFSEYNTAGLHGEGKAFLPVDAEFFSPPTLTKHWFHQGPLGEEFGDWYEANYSDEYWTGDPQRLERHPAITDFLRGLKRRVKRDALRALRGQSLRTEMYALDGTEREGRPYTVTEHLFGIREESAPGPAPESGRHHVFFSFQMAQRATQWERGDDPLTSFTFNDDYDAFGQPRKQTDIACPRGWRTLADVSPESFLATRSITDYATPANPSVYIQDRASRESVYELVNDGALPVTALRDLPDNDPALVLIGQEVYFYDGPAFIGRDFGEVGDQGALVRTEVLVLTEDILHEAYRSGNAILPDPEIPPFLNPAGPPAWTNDYPQAFRDSLPDLAGYTFHAGGPGSPFARGYFAANERKSFDFQDGSGQRGLVRAVRDPLGRDTSIHYNDYDRYELLPSRTRDPQGLEIRAAYDYRVLQVRQVTDPSGNHTAYAFSPAGLLSRVAVMGKTGENLGDTRAAPGVEFVYGFMRFVQGGNPVSVRTIKREHHIHDTDVPLPERNETVETVEYFDGFGRLLQRRSRAEDVVFGQTAFGDAGLALEQTSPSSPAAGRLRSAAEPPRVVVDGWKVHDNKAQIVEQYEPFFSQGWDYTLATDALLGQKITYFYDPRGQQLRTVYPDGSEKLMVPGIPQNLNDPFAYDPTPWEAYTYDPNDNAGRTHPGPGAAYAPHWQTPESVRVDALGRDIETIQRNGPNPATDWYRVESRYDMRGNLVFLKNPLGQTAFRITYDMMDEVVRVNHVDAGARRRIMNAAGNLIEQRDGKGSLILKGYDSLNRHYRTWATDRPGEPVTLREIKIYGEAAESGLASAQAADRNLLGNIYRHYDEAGLLEFSHYDFKGNVLDKLRRPFRNQVLLRVFTPAPPNWEVHPFRVDWQHPDGSDLETHAETLLDATVFQTRIQYDALERLKHLRYPEDVDGERKRLTPRYNRAGVLESVTLDGAPYVRHIAYNAKGQRLLIVYGNGIMTRYAYDPLMVRLRRMRTERFSQPDSITYQPTGPALQDMGYTYDLQGNMLSLHNRAPGSGTDTQPNQLDRTFTYDPIYRLLTATGRECGQPAPSQPWLDDPRCQDVNQTKGYTEAYRYDAAGNMEQLRHHVDGGGGFERDFTLIAGKNQLGTLSVGPDNFAFHYDGSGNLVREHTERFFEWDHSDRLRAFRQQTGNAEPTIYTQYLYDTSGRRAQKITRRPGGAFRSTIYIDDQFEFHHEQDNGATRTNNHLHIMDDEKRIAFLRVGLAFPTDTGPEVQYHLGDHLNSCHLVLNPAGYAVSLEEYTPFGETSFGGFEAKRYRFTGNERDDETGLYYMGARYFAPALARWFAIDPLALDYAHESPYVFVGNNPMIHIDPDGLEKIVVSGGEYTSSNRYKYNFIEPAIRQVKEYKKTAGSEQVTWLVITHGYSKQDLAKMKDVADKLGVTFGPLALAKDLTRYINRQQVNSNGLKESQMASRTTVTADRLKDPVTGITIFGHGFVGSMEFGYRQSNTEHFSYKTEEIKNLSPKSFNKATIDLYTCNAATPVGKSTDLWTSFAGQLALKTKTKVTGYQGRSDYAKMNNGQTIGDKWNRYRNNFNTRGSKQAPEGGRQSNSKPSKYWYFDERPKPKKEENK